MRFMATDVAHATGGRLSGKNAHLSGATFDSRTLVMGQLFAPIVAQRDGRPKVVWIMGDHLSPAPLLDADLQPAAGGRTVFHALARYDDEVKSLQELKSITPNSNGAIDRSIVDTYRAAKNLDKALAYCEEALKTQPDAIPLQLARADIIAEKGRTDEAIRSL